MLWSERKAKDETRKRVLSCLDPHKSNLILNLPGNEALFEKMVAAMCTPPNEFVLFERDTHLIPEIRRTLDQLPIKYNLRNQDVDYYLRDQLLAPEKKFDLIWLDYCGPLTPLRLNIASKLDSLINETGVYAFTFMMGRETEGVMNIIEGLGSSEMFHVGGGATTGLQLPENMPEPLELRVKTLLKMIWPACRKTKITILSYNDTVPMYVLLVQKGRLLGTELVPCKRLTLEWIEL